MVAGKSFEDSIIINYNVHAVLQILQHGVYV